MTAEQAKEMARQAPERRYRQKLLEIDDGIEKAAYEGKNKYEIQIEHSWEQALRTLDESRGFNVKFAYSVCRPMLNYVMIYW